MEETSALSLVRRLAAGEAFRLKHAAVEPEHILLALAKLEDPAAYAELGRIVQDPLELIKAQAEVAALLELFERASIDPVQLRRELRRISESFYPGTVATNLPPRRSALSRALFARAIALARQLKAELLTTVHVLAALAEGHDEQSTIIGEVLQSLGARLELLYEYAIEVARAPLTDDTGSVVARSSVEAPLFLPQPELDYNVPLRHLRALYTISRAIAAATLTENLSVVASAIEAALPSADRGAILLLGQGEKFYVAAHWPAEQFSLSIRWAERALREREAFIWADDRTQGETPPSLIAAGVRSAIYASLCHADANLGVIYVDSSSSPDAFTIDDLELIRAVATQIALALYLQEARRERERLVAIRAHLAHQFGPDLVDRLSTTASAPLWSTEAFALTVFVRPGAMHGHDEKPWDLQHVGAALAGDLLRRGAALDRSNTMLIAVYGALNEVPHIPSIPIAAARALARHPLPPGWSLGIGLAFGPLYQVLVAAAVAVDDPYTTYEEGLEKLQILLVTQESIEVKLALLTLIQRLRENISNTRSFGNTEARRAERSEIIIELNRWALQYLHTSYNDLCSAAKPAGAAPVSQLYKATGPTVDAAWRLAVAGTGGAVLIDIPTYYRFKQQMPAAKPHPTENAMVFHEQ